MSRPRETCGKNPGLGIGAHPRWSPRSSVWLQDPVFTTWPQEAFLSGLLLPPTHSALSSSPPPTSPHRYLHSLFMSNTLPRPRLYLCLAFPLALPSAMQSKLLFTCQASNHTTSSGKHSRLPQSHRFLWNCVHTSLTALRILMIIMAKHVLITY